MFPISGTPKPVKHNEICIYGSFWKGWSFFPPILLNKLSRILARGRRKESMDDREITLWRCWGLTLCYLPAVRASAPSHECTRLKHQYLQNTTLEFGLSKNQVSFTESPTDKFLVHVAVWMSKICSGVQQASVSLGTAVGSPTGSDCTSAPFPTSHWKWPVRGRTSSCSEGKSKQSIPCFSGLSPLLFLVIHCLWFSFLNLVIFPKSLLIRELPPTRCGWQKSFPLPEMLNTS